MLSTSWHCCSAIESGFVIQFKKSVHIDESIPIVHVIIGLLIIRIQVNWQISRFHLYGSIQFCVCAYFLDKHLENIKNSWINRRIWGFYWKKCVSSFIFLFNKLNKIHLHSGSVDSNSKAMYIEMIEKIERLSQLIHIGVIKLSIPGVIVPALLITFINFFVYDFGNESFFLPFPVT